MSTTFVDCPNSVFDMVIEEFGWMSYDWESTDAIYDTLYKLCSLPESGHWVVFDDGVTFKIYAEFTNAEDAMWFKMKYG